MLRQGTNRLNQGLGSDGSGRKSEQTGLVRTWRMLTEGSVRGTVAGARNSELGCRHSGHGGNGS